MPIADLTTLVNATAQNLSQFKGLSVAYNLLGGAPSIAGYSALIKANNDSNFGAGAGTTFNDENVYINTLNALYQGNAAAKTAFDGIVNSGATLSDKLELVYNNLIPTAARTDAGLAYFKSQAAFYQAKAIELGVAGPNGAALVAYAGLAKIAVDNDIGGLGDTVNDLVAAVNNGTAVLPESGTVFTPLETADGTQFDDDDVTPTEGPSFSLTNVIGESVAGTSANDTFNGVFATGATTDSTVNIGDTVDGRGGNDTLNILGTGAGTALPAGFATKSVEKIFLNNGGAIATVDATKFVDAEQIWIVDNKTSVAVNGLTSTQTVGVKGDTGATTVTGNFGAGTVANLALDGAKGTAALTSTDATVKGTTNISGSSLVTAGAAQTVTVNGSAVVNSSALNVTAAAMLKLDITAGANVTTTKVMGTGNADLGTLGAATKTLDASGNTGGVTATGVALTQEVTGGAGKDAFTAGGALNDKGFINTGAGDDMVNLGANAVNKGASINLGDGNDSIIGTGAISKDAPVDGGAGTDTLALTLVGAVNVGTFSNFEVFDVNALNGNLDLDILASKNTVTEIIGSGPLGGNSTLTNVGAGVNFRATKDMNTAAALTLDQKTAGAITVTLDVDTTKTGAPAGNDAEVKVILEDATAATVKFDSSSFDAQVAGGLRNTQQIDLQTKAATTITVESGGANADNVLILKDSSVKAGDSLLTKVVVTGSQALDATGLTIDNANKLAEVDASAHTGGLTIDLADILNGGTVKIGSGTDIIKTVDNGGATTGNIESVVGFEKAASTKADDTKVADLIDHANALTVGIEDVAGAALDISKGVVTFLGTGPTTLDQAITQVDAAVTALDSAVLFQYIGNSYVFINDDVAGDTVVQLTGITGVTEIGVNAGSDLFIV
tara:strand:+ start:33606 stop:36299 length:2694 start_codon:yes stop_codon:yes gene_type:complete